MKKLLNKIISVVVIATMLAGFGVAVNAEVGETVTVGVTSSAFSVSETAVKHTTGPHYQLDNTVGDWAKYTPELSGGVYEIEVYVPIGNNPNVGNNNIVEIVCASGISTLNYNAQEIATGYYKLNGQYTFEPGNSGYVKITDGDTTTRLGRAGDVKFTKVAEANLAYIDSAWIADTADSVITLNFTMAQESTITDLITLTKSDGSTVECTKTPAEDGMSVQIKPTTVPIANDEYVLAINDDTIVGTSEFNIGVFASETVTVGITSSAFSVSDTAVKHSSGNHYQLDDDKNDWAKYAPELSGGVYEIEVYVPIGENPNVGKNNVAEIVCADGISTLNYNAQEIATGYYKLNGQYTFDSGNSGYVKITDGDAELRTARVSSVRFTKVAEANLASIDNEWVSKDASITVNFNIKQQSADNVKLYNGETLITTTNTLSDDGKSVIVNPENDLTVGEDYTIKIEDETIIGTKEFVVNVFEAETVIVDDSSSGFSYSGDSDVSDRKTNAGYKSTVYFMNSGSTSSWAQYNVDLSGGTYEIYAHVYIINTSSKNIKAVITTAEGTKTTNYDTYTKTGWIKLDGQYNFTNENQAIVKISNVDTSRRYVADAFKFVKIAGTNSAGIRSTKLAMDEDLVIDFAMKQTAGIENNVTLTDASGNTVEASYTLSEDLRSIVINPVDNLSLGQSYTVTLNDDSILGTKTWTVTTTVADEVIVTPSDVEYFKYYGGSFDLAYGGFNGKGVWHSLNTNETNGEYALVSPDLAGGKYRVYSYIHVNSGYSKAVGYEVTSLDATKKGFYSMMNQPVGWVDLGEYEFAPGMDGTVKIYLDINNEYIPGGRRVAFSALKFVKVDDNATAWVNDRVEASGNIEVKFSSYQDAGILDKITVTDSESNVVECDMTFGENNMSVIINPENDLTVGNTYVVSISDGEFTNANGWNVLAVENNVNVVLDEESKTVDVNVSYVNGRKGNIVVALYKENKLVGVKSTESNYDTEKTIEDISYSDTPDYIKVMLWNDMSNMKPVYKTIEKPIVQE